MSAAHAAPTGVKGLIKAHPAARGRTPIARGAPRVARRTRCDARRGNASSSASSVAIEFTAEELDRVEVPRDLIQIRAYVRWEEAGKPENTTPEWQASEFKAAALDLKREVANGLSLNAIRKRYGQAPVDGDDESRALEAKTVDAGRDEARREAEKEEARRVVEAQMKAAAIVVDEPVTKAPSKAPAVEKEPPAVVVAPEVVAYDASERRRGRNLRELLAPSALIDTQETKKSTEPSIVERWRAMSADDDGRMLIGERIYPLADGELIVQVFEFSERDEEAESAPRNMVTSRQVVMTTNALEPLIVHWGVAKDEPGQWILPKKDVHPEGTKVVSHMSCETPLVPFEGCFPADRVSSTAAMDEQELDACYFMQSLTFDLPGAGPNELMGLHFVFRDAAGTHWYKDASNGNANFQASCMRVNPKERTVDDLVDAITRAEAGNSWWSLMHRFNLAHSLLKKHCGDAESASNAIEAAAKIFVWLRFSSIRQLTWQRNYNVKPRELSSAQSKLTHSVAEIYCSKPHLRDVARLMLGTLGKGGEGGQGQQIRDEILNIMHRNNIKEVKGIWMEEWHQKLHNNTTPDDIVICDAYLNFLRAEGDLNAYWSTLTEGGVTRERLESFERPVKSEPIWRPQIKNELIRDFENYRKILKSVHSGADLEESFNACRGRLSNDVVQSIQFIMQNQSSGDIFHVIGACLEARHGLRDSGLADAKDPAWVRELLYLDISIADVSNRAIQRGAEAVSGIEGQMELTDMVLEDLCLSLPSTNDDLLFSLLNWRRIREAKNNGDADWALRAKATVDRIRLAVTEHASKTFDLMQPTADVIGRRCNCESWTVELFSEEVIRGGPAFALSLVLTRLDPYLREQAKMGDWQVISPATCSGQVKRVVQLEDVMNDTFQVPTILICDYVGGDEEIPSGAVAVVTGSSVDVLSHSAVRARNSDVLFATCYDPSILLSFTKMNGKSLKMSVGADEIVKWEEIEFSSIGQERSSQSHAAGSSNATSPIHIKDIKFGGKYAIGMDAFRDGVVGAKARNTKSLRDALVSGGIPDWIQLPVSVAIPFGTFEDVLANDVNASQAKTMDKLLREIDDSSGESLKTSLKLCRTCARSVTPPPGMLDAVGDVMRAGGLTPPSDEDGWNLAWKALCDVWASKWNERAFISMRNRRLDHGKLRMSVLVQPVIDADYAFVIHTTNPSNNDATELYAEVVQGLGETLVGNYPGRALSFTVKKGPNGEVSKPEIGGFPSKNSVLRVPCETLIFRSDSNGEDLEGYAGAGLYESVPMHHTIELHADYGGDALIWDPVTQEKLLSDVARAGVAIERALGAAQDVEGVIRNGKIYIVQTRPQV